MKRFQPVVISSLHGFKSHGKWQHKLTAFLGTKRLPGYGFDYGYRLIGCLIPGFKNRLVKDFYSAYCSLVKNKDYKIDNKNPSRRPSIVAHSLGSYILCQAMMMHRDIKFDKIILCGSIVDEDFDWHTLFQRNQVHFVRNEFSPKDGVVKWGWILNGAKKGHSGWNGFTYNSNYFEQERLDLFNHSTFFEGAHMEHNWLPFLLKPPPEFQVIRGKDVKDSDFNIYFVFTKEIDDISYGPDPNWNNFSIPAGLAKEWIKVNKDIYSFLMKDEKLNDVVGYINAMPIKKDTFEKILTGVVHDNEITKSDILSY